MSAIGDGSSHIPDVDASIGAQGADSAAPADTGATEQTHDHDAAAKERPDIAISAEMGAAGLRALVEQRFEAVPFD